MKYFVPDTDYTALERELSGTSGYPSQAYQPRNEPSEEFGGVGEPAEDDDDEF